MKKYIATLLIVFTASFGFAQDFFDALRYSQTEYGGTARSIAMGSAFGALGGDFASASINPAGLGLYRSGEFAMSPTLNYNQIESNYLDNNEMNDRYNFNFNNISYVSSIETGAKSGILSFSFGFGYNRLKNFNSNQLIQGYDATTTLLNYYTDYANDIMNADNFNYHHEGLAWNSWLVDADGDPEVLEGVYFNNLTEYNRYDINDENGNYIGIGYEAAGVKKHQQKSVISRYGNMDEYDFSLGLNIDNRLYIGGTIGMVDLNYTEKVSYSEIDNNELDDYFSNYTLSTRLADAGFGMNFKTGIIYRPFKSLRLGFSVHTPTFYNMERAEDKDIVANYDQPIGNEEFGYQTQWSDNNEIYYEYRFETPLRTNISAAYVLGNKAIVSADYELINYGNSKFRNSKRDNYDYSDHNAEIYDVFQTTGNLRIGAEYRLTPNFSLRGGYNMIGNPWKASYTYSDGTESAIENSSDSFSNYSAGFGYRQKHFFVDFAYRISQSNTTFKVHELYYTNPGTTSNLATLNETNNQATLTVGFRF